MMILVQSDLPTIYADINVFRYVAYGELTVEAPERFRWVYSHVHLDEIRSTGNRDALGGMRQLRAVEIQDVLNEGFQSTGTVILRDYVDPDTGYLRHLDAVTGYENAGNSLTEVLLRLFGADNFETLSGVPEMLSSEIDGLTKSVNSITREELQDKAHRVATEMALGIEQHMKERKPLDQVRGAFGLTSEDRRAAARSESPIDSLWAAIGSQFEGIDKDQFFGLKPVPGVHTGTRSRLHRSRGLHRT